MRIEKIGFGGGCHWCTEAIFQCLHGVIKVQQGWISAVEAEEFHEAVVVHFKSDIISLEKLIEVHLYTHNCTANHSMRDKYRSAVYTHNKMQHRDSANILKQLQKDFDNKLVTRVFGFKEFKMSPEPYQNYYLQNPDKPFCKTYIHPKLQMLLRRFPKNVKESPLAATKTDEA
ncbi:peptide-methionine (S)-S-oxide reductase [uncultured Eudoraea sp.]|uniref:peptide-methionine (S)-S-oxide reductase n=1 Tax=uncultured Eudoraea sp. TaxID=1035614 RepID=UPI0026083B4E|nr:peptide-methionine (S)-S-oxide reductase [uncultured Eudoraea sp.]